MFCQASMKVKLSPLSVLCSVTFMLVVNKNALLAFTVSETYFLEIRQEAWGIKCYEKP